MNQEKNILPFQELVDKALEDKKRCDNERYKLMLKTFYVDSINKDNVVIHNAINRTFGLKNQALVFHIDEFPFIDVTKLLVLITNNLTFSPYIMYNDELDSFVTVKQHCENEEYIYKITYVVDSQCTRVNIAQECFINILEALVTVHKNIANSKTENNVSK